jgi:excisionase family DNA binding protein
MPNEPRSGQALKDSQTSWSSKDTIRNWIKKGVIRTVGLASNIKFRFSEVDAWVDSGQSAEIE